MDEQEKTESRDGYFGLLSIFYVLFIALIIYYSQEEPNPNPVTTPKYDEGHDQGDREDHRNFGY